MFVPTERTAFPWDEEPIRVGVQLVLGGASHADDTLVCVWVRSEGEVIVTMLTFGE